MCSCTACIWLLFPTPSCAHTGPQPLALVPFHISAELLMQTGMNVHACLPLALCGGGCVVVQL